MDDLNQFVISRVFGGTMKQIKRPSFGPLGVLHIQNQVLAQFPKRDEQITFLPQAEKLIVRAFEETRQGFPVDRVLADQNLAAKFFKRCRHLEVLAPDHVIALRLLAIRKSPRRHARISKATAKEPRRDYSPYLFAAEMAITQMKYRYDASVDDILAYSEIGKEFDNLASRLYPGMTSLDYRLAALYVRKSRYCKPEERSLFNSIKTTRAESTLERLDSLQNIDVDKFRNVNGIVGLVEESRNTRFLYITDAENVAEIVRPFTKQDTFKALGNSFWTPSIASIYVYLYNIHDKFGHASQLLWTKKLIHEKEPIFNRPISLSSSVA